MKGLLVSAYRLLRSDDEWMAHAECAKYDPALWDGYQEYKNGPVLYDKAREICNSCSVRLFCLEAAIEHEEVAGMRGGLTPKEYMALAKQRRRFADVRSA